MRDRLRFLSRFARATVLALRILASYVLQSTLEKLLRRELPPRPTGSTRSGATLPPPGASAPPRASLAPSDPNAPKHKQPAWLKRRAQTLHERNAKRLLHGILELQGVYVKLGQVLSIMGGFLPNAFRKQLEALQDAVPPRALSEMRPHLEKSLGRTLDQAFAAFDETPIAAASLGQVHSARLADGRRVAVKILYPGIRALIAADLVVVGVLLRAYQRFLPVGNFEIVHTSLVDLLRRETDYVHEAQCMRRFAENFAPRSEIVCPEVIAELSTDEVLTMTFMEGVKISHVTTLAQQNVSAEAVARRLLECFFEQLLVHRFFHADPHPGNFLVQAGDGPDEPRLVVLDFGTISEAPSELIEGLMDVLVAYFGRDGAALLSGFSRMGFIAHEADRTLLEQTVLLYFERLLSVKHKTPGAIMRARSGDLKRLFDPNMELRRVRELARSFTYPEGWFYVERAFVMTFWLCGEIFPDIDMLQVAFPYVMPKLAERQAQQAAAQAAS